MGIGSFLSVIFYAGLVYITGAITRFSGLLTIIASVTMLAVALADVTFMVAAVNAAILGHMETTKVAFDFIAGPGEAFDYTFIFVPAPFLVTSVGFVLLRYNIVPRFFGYAAFAVGMMFFITGILSIFFPRGCNGNSFRNCAAKPGHLGFGFSHLYSHSPQKIVRENATGDCILTLAVTLALNTRWPYCHLVYQHKI